MLAADADQPTLKKARVGLGRLGFAGGRGGIGPSGERSAFAGGDASSDHRRDRQHVQESPMSHVCSPFSSPVLAAIPSFY